RGSVRWRTNDLGKNQNPSYSQSVGRERTLRASLIILPSASPHLPHWSEVRDCGYAAIGVCKIPRNNGSRVATCPPISFGTTVQPLLPRISLGVRTQKSVPHSRVM